MLYQCEINVLGNKQQTIVNVVNEKEKKTKTQTIKNHTNEENHCKLYSDFF